MGLKNVILFGFFCPFFCGKESIFWLMVAVGVPLSCWLQLSDIQIIIDLV